MKQNSKGSPPSSTAGLFIQGVTPVSSALGKPKTELQDSSDEHVCLELWRVQMSLLITVALLTFLFLTESAAAYL